MSERYPFIAVYIMANRKNGTIYTGVTANLPEHYYAHSIGQGSIFTARYGCKILVWFARHDLMTSAIRHEKRIKKYPRQWKLKLINAMNPVWRDLSDDIHL